MKINIEDVESQAVRIYLTDLFWRKKIRESMKQCA